MTTTLRVLIAAESEAIEAALLNELRRGGFDPDSLRVQTATAFHAALKLGSWQLILAARSTPGFSALDAFALLEKSGQDIPFILISEIPGDDLAVTVARKLRQANVAPEQSQKLEALGRLAGGIAHDFNNLLAVIGMYVDTAQSQLATAHPAYEAISGISKAQQHGAALTRQLLAFSRRQRVELRVLNLNQIVSHMDPMLRRLVGEDIELVTELSPNLGRIHGDPGQLEQILMNLVVNARDAIEKTGVIRVRTRNLGSAVSLAVSDTGTGMDTETQARLFEPFFTTKAPGKGTGLGLSTVYGILKQCKGVISVRSEPGQGTEFTVRFPLHEGANAEAPAASPSPELLTRNGTILMVEDEDSLRMAICVSLRKHGFHVLEADNGETALKICEEFRAPIDLIVTDIVMPKMGGMELAERIRLARPNTRLLYLSGHTEDTLLRYGMSRSDASFLDKPFTTRAFVDKVRTILGGQGS